MRTAQKQHLKHPNHFKQQLLLWSQQFNTVVWLDSNAHHTKYSSYDAILAVDAFTELNTNYTEAFQKLKTYQSSLKDWIFGYLTYDLKNTSEQLSSHNFDALEFPDLYFFQPKKLFLIKDNCLEIKYLDEFETEVEDDYKAIEACHPIRNQSASKAIKIKLRTHKERYFESVQNILNHIHRGDIYEANFCQEFYAEDSCINPLETYTKLNKISKSPFATFLKLNDKFLLSATPERYIKKTGTTVISQPIKGTAKRSLDKATDTILKENLYKDQKERSENIMIVDLVRNDLSHTATKGSVTVETLCEIESFLQVHQMTSTITSKVPNAIHPVDILKSTFPMGSMTGAPKISALKIIEHFEDAKRGLYSGSVGYITPNGDFDFNVIIRSILYNSSKKYISYSVGSAITAKSNPLHEYEECLIKAKAMREVLEN